MDWLSSHEHKPDNVLRFSFPPRGSRARLLRLSTLYICKIRTIRAVFRLLREKFSKIFG
jgi:hypothetical protein